MPASAEDAKRTFSSHNWTQSFEALFTQPMSTSVTQCRFVSNCGSNFMLENLVWFTCRTCLQEWAVCDDLPGQALSFAKSVKRVHLPKYFRPQRPLLKNVSTSGFWRLSP